MRASSIVTGTPSTAWRELSTMVEHVSGLLDDAHASAARAVNDGRHASWRDALFAPSDPRSRATYRFATREDLGTWQASAAGAGTGYLAAVDEVERIAGMMGDWSFDAAERPLAERAVEMLGRTFDRGGIRFDAVRRGVEELQPLSARAGASARSLRNGSLQVELREGHLAASDAVRGIGWAADNARNVAQGVATRTARP